MCLIIHKPAGKAIPDWVINSAYESNSDGIGIMHSGTMRKWAHLDPERIKQELQELEDVELAVHFRMATDGRVNKKNAHPFKLKNGAYLMHNGILSKYRTAPDAEESDTRRFIREFCNPLISKHGSIPRALLEPAITGNKICIGQRDGTISRYGSGWLEYFGCYFSNTYAWDAPDRWSDLRDWACGLQGNTRKYLPKMDYSIDSEDFDHDTDTEDFERWSEDTALDLHARIYARLIEVSDLLPWSTLWDYIAASDGELYTDLLDGYLDEVDFLACASADTTLNLYSWAVKVGYIGADN